MSDGYDKKLSEWKARVGMPEGFPDGEAMMVAEDAKRKGLDYCVECGERFKISEMRLITRTDDPYIQYEEEATNSRKPDYYIPVKYRCRACKPCFKEHYEDGYQDEEENES